MDGTHLPACFLCFPGLSEVPKKEETEDFIQWLLDHPLNDQNKVKLEDKVLYSFNFSVPLAGWAPAGLSTRSP